MKVIYQAKLNIKQSVIDTKPRDLYTSMIDAKPSDQYTQSIRAPIHHTAL